MPGHDDVVEAKGDNLTKSGVRYDNDYCLVFRLEDGKIKEGQGKSGNIAFRC